MNGVYKERKPEETIEKVEEFLNTTFHANLVYKKSNENALAPSYVLMDRKIGLIVNGKGTTDSYAKASACGEFMERLFNRAFLRMNNCTTEMLNFCDNAYEYVDYSGVENAVKRLLCLEDCNDKQVCQLLVNIINQITAKSCVPESYPMIKYENNTDYVYIPVALSDYLYGTNGMAAGNSYEEAYVQAYSELMERKCIRLFNSGKVRPDLVGEVFDNNSSVVKMIRQMEMSNCECRCLTFEKTMGFPIALVLLIDREHKLIRFKFGAHTNIYYAVERCLTEMAQGCDWDDRGKWLSIESVLRCASGENMKIFEDGSGAISSLAYKSAIDANQRFCSLWNTKSYQEAVELIESSNRNIYCKVYMNNPLVVLQLYQPITSRLFDFDVVTLKNEIGVLDRKLFLRKMVDNNLAKNDAANILAVIKKEDSIFMYENMTFLCPIQRQYLDYLNKNNKIRSLLKAYLSGDIKNPLNYCNYCTKCETDECMLACRREYSSCLSRLYYENRVI